MKTEWRYPFDEGDLAYLSSKAKQINDIAALFGVPATRLAGGIAREMTLERWEYQKDPWRRFGQPLKAWLTSTEVDQPGRDPVTADLPLLPWKPITHGTIADYFARSNTLPRNTLANPTLGDRFENPIFFDVGPANLKIRTAITMLDNYNRMFPDPDYDPLRLKRYNDHYDLLVRDLKNPDSDTSIKIAGLVAREGRDFYIKAMTPQRWTALSEDQKAAALTKYYALGKERMEDDFLKQGGVPRTYTPDFDGDGSDMYLYDPGNGTPSNPARLKGALFPPVRKQDKHPVAPGRRTDSGPGVYDVAAAEPAAPPPAAGSPVPVQTRSSALPPQVVANGNYLRANGFEITPRTMYVTHLLGPERAVELFRTGSTGSPPEVPSPDAATGDQMRAWARALRGYGTAPLAGGIASIPGAGQAIGSDTPAGTRDANGFLP